MTTLAEKPQTEASNEGSGSRVSTLMNGPSSRSQPSLESLAETVLAQDRGRFVQQVPVTVSIHRFLKRLFALPLGGVMGFGLGSAGSLLALVLPGSLLQRIGRSIAGPWAGLFFGLWLGGRVALRGDVDALPLVLAFLHKRYRIISFPKALRHHVFGLVFVLNYEDVRSVLSNDEVFRVDGYDDRMRATTGPFFLGMDPGLDYDRDQALGAAAVGRNAEPLRTLVADLSRALVEKAYARSRTIDVVTELTHPVQLAALDRYYGIPDSPDKKLITWLETCSFYVFNFWIGGPYRTAAIEGGHAMCEHLRSVVEQRIDDMVSGQTRDDVLGRMLDKVRAEIGADATALSLKDDNHVARVVRIMAGLISGATVATMGLFTNSVDRILMQSTDEHDALKKAAAMNDDKTVKQYVVEAARFFTYPPTLYRHARETYTFHAGTDREAVAEKGAWVVTLPVFANYDPTMFPEPDKFNPLRQYEGNSGPLLFGWSRHRCLGEHMAVLSMVEMAKALFAKGVSRGDPGISNGTSGVIPDGDYPARFVVRLH